MKEVRIINKGRMNDLMKQQWHMIEMEMDMSDRAQQRRMIYTDLMRNKETLWFNPFDIEDDDEEDDEDDDDDDEDEDDEDEEDWIGFVLSFHGTLSFSLYPPFGTGLPHTTQICSIKLTREDMESIDVYGLIHVYSQTGYHYQVILDRERDNCETLTQKDPYLVLTGPILAPLAPPHRLVIQGTLKLKSNTQSEVDKFLSVSICCEDGKLTDMQKVREYQDRGTGNPFVCTKPDFGKPYLLELTRCVVMFSFVATISVRVINKDIPLPDCCFTAFPETDSMRDMKVVLLDSRDRKVTLDIKRDLVQLSRRTICVESGECLIIRIEHGSEEEDLRFSTGEFNAE